MDRYRVEKVVGKGSFGQAILCARITDGKACIVKQVDTSKLPSKARREASKEATLLAKLSHPNIVGFWESFFHGPSRDVLCIVMDYADGGDLSSCLRRRNGRPLDEEVVLDWFVQTTLALKHIHDRKILHRDLKTQNIFLTRSRVVKLGDFGIAKVLGNTLDLAKTAIGTPYYMSPEICQEKRYNHKSDMWSLGCVLYEMTCLRHAFEGTNMRLLVMKICSQDPRPISARYSSGVRNLVAQLLKKDPHARPSTGSVLRRPLIKNKISRFLSEAQIREEFSDGVSPGHQPSSPAANVTDAGGSAAANPHPGADRDGPRWPFHAAGIGRPRQAGAAPRSVAGGRDDRNFGRAGVGSGGGKITRAAGVVEGRRRSVEAEEAGEERRRAEALARKKGVRVSPRAAAAKQRGQLAAVALNVARPSSAERRPAKPKRPKSAEDAASRQQRDYAKQAKQRALDDAKRAQERAEVARAVLGVVGGGKSASPGSASRHGSSSSSSSCSGDVKAQASRRRPSARAPAISPPAGSGAVGAREDGSAEERAFQPGKSLRRQVGGLPAGAGTNGLAQPRSSNGEGEGGGGAQPGGVVGAGKYNVDGMTAALELARRRRAARAVFGPGFGGQESEEARPQQQGEEESKRRISDVRVSDRDRSPSAGVREVSPAAPPRQAEEKPVTPMAPTEFAAERTNVLSPSEPARPLDDPPNDFVINNDVFAPSEGKKGGGCPEEVDQKKQREEAVPGVVPDSLSHQDEQKGHGEDFGVSVKGLGGGGGLQEEKDVAVAGDGDGEVRGKINLGVQDGWFQNLEAKMGAIKKQVEQIKSPPLSSPRRRGIDHRNNPSSNGSGKDVPVDAMPRIYQTPCERQPQQRPGFSGMSDDDHDGGSDEDIDWSVGDGPPVIDSVTPLAERLEGPAEEKGWGREDAEGREAREAHDAEDLSAGGESPVVGATAAARCRGGRRRGDDASRSAALRRCNSQQQTARLTAAAAAVETAAAVVAAISPGASENDQTPGVRRHSSESDLVGRHGYRRRRSLDREDDNGNNNDEEEEDGTAVHCVGGGAGSGSARARLSPPGGPGGVRVVTTPAQRGGGGGRVARRPPLSSRSERKPPRHAAALAAELERHSEKRPQKSTGKSFKSLRRDDEEKGTRDAKTPTAEERVQALRATRDREREALKALIASRRRQSSKENVETCGGGSGGLAGREEGASKSDLHADPDGPLLRHEWNSPGERTAARGGRPRHGGAAGGPASEPPPRRGGRLRTKPSDGTPVSAAVARKKGEPSGRSVDGSRRRERQGPSGGGDGGIGRGDSGGTAGAADAERDPANRQQNLRAFVAERRRNQRARRSSGSDGERDSGISVLVPSGRRRGSPGHLAFATPGGAEEQEEEEEGAGGEVAAARRNIGLDFDEEDRSWGVKRGAEGGATEEVKEEEGVEEKEKDEDSVASSGGNDSGASSRSPSPSTPSWRNREQERAVGGEAADALEGVHPGLATYDSQRAAGVDGGDRAGQEEYARMLELMQQEVLELGDGASTDSGWGESSSSTGEEKSSARDDGDEERSSGSSRGGSGDGGRHGGGGTTSCVSTPELAVFLFQGGVNSGSCSGDGGGCEAKEDDGSSAALQGREEHSAEFSSSLVPLTDDRQLSDLEYSRSGPQRERSADTASKAPACVLAGGVGGAGVSAAGGEKDPATAKSVNPTESRRQQPAAVVHDADRRESQKGGTKSSSLTDELRGVDFLLN